ncbi:uncharacterized protein LOC141648685 [Silene latifolia]|uniref:uncharacterized protein LOC141648685 n=1 Tax=Silene latifolia TaxID=37657 RepID=UPI003D772AA8
MASSSSTALCRAGVNIKLPPHLCVDLTGLDFNRVLTARFVDQRYLDVDRILYLIGINWRLNGSISIRPMKPYYLFSFSSMADYKYFRKRQTVNIDGSLLVLRPCSATSFPDNMLFHIVPVWVRVLYLPFHLMHSSVAAYLLSHVGDICEEEVVNSLTPPRCFVRVKVWVDLSKPLIPGCYLEIDDRTHQWIGFSYEGVFRFCKTCGEVGHRVSFCPSGKIHGARRIRARMEELSASGLMVLHGPPGSRFYTPEIMGLPSRVKYLTSRIDIAEPDESAQVDSGGDSPVFSFSSSPSNNGGDEEAPFAPPPSAFMVHEDESREVLLESHPLRRSIPDLNGASSSAVPVSPSFRMRAPEMDLDPIMDLGLPEPVTPPRHVDVGILFRDPLVAGPSSGSGNSVPMDSSGRKLKFVFKRKDMYVMFLYGEPVFQYRSFLWDNISNEISGCSPFLVIGDFNQVELHSDKLGGSLTIRGQAEFTAWKFHNNLVDIPFFGPRFTWMNGQLANHCIMERLDRAYATQDWIDLFPASSVLHLPILISDHSPIMLRFMPQPKSRKRPYRLDNWCLQIPEVMTLVSNAWNTPVYGSSSYVLSRKLAAARFAILNWVIQHHICYGINWCSLECDLLQASTSLSDSDDALLYHNLRSSHLQLLSKQHSYWIQRNKTRKEILDGLPTRFLFNRVKQRSSKQRLISLRTSDGTWINDPVDIEARFVLISDLFGRSKSSP